MWVYCRLRGTWLDGYGIGRSRPQGYLFRSLVDALLQHIGFSVSLQPPQDQYVSAQDRIERLVGSLSQIADLQGTVKEILGFVELCFHEQNTSGLVETRDMHSGPQ